MERLIRLYEEFGQSPWLDNLKRGYLTSGELARLRDEGIRGQTSNPTIFQKAIEGSADYDDQFRDARARRRRPIVDDYWALVLQDINGALDVFAPLYESSRRRRRLRQRRGGARHRRRHRRHDRRPPATSTRRSTGPTSW